MKSSQFLLAGLIAALSLTAWQGAFAIPRAAEASGANYLAAAEDLAGWHIGGFYRYQSRSLDTPGDNLSQDNIAMTVGRDIFPWLAVYGLVGTTDTQRDLYGDDADYAFLWGGGAWVNLIDHDILATLSTETKLRVQAIGQVSFASPDINGESCDYRDYYAALTISIVNEIIGNKNLWPDAVGLFFGPVFSDIHCDDFDTDGDTLGFGAGLDIYINRATSLSGSYETFGSDDDAVTFSLNFNF